MNAGTDYDYTIYFINVPANKLELWYWMESDRLMNPVFREFYTERDGARGAPDAPTAPPPVF
jgi:predicted Zn-dependent peptidase